MNKTNKLFEYRAVPIRVEENLTLVENHMSF